MAQRLAKMPKPARSSTGPVSYTHLDVYKRQAYFEGQYPLACGEKTLSVHPYQMSDIRYFGSIFEKLWRESGGGFNGHVIEGAVPPEAQILSLIHI